MNKKAEESELLRGLRELVDAAAAIPIGTYEDVAPKRRAFTSKVCALVRMVEKAEKEPAYTYEHLEAAACMWEHVLHSVRRAKPGDKNPWNNFREAYGMAELRERVITHAPVLEVAYQAALANGYDKPFDWEYVPKYLEDHVARVLT